MVKKMFDSAGSCQGKMKGAVGSTIADELNSILGVYRGCGEEKTFSFYKTKWRQHLRGKHFR